MAVNANPMNTSKNASVAAAIAAILIVASVVFLAMQLGHHRNMNAPGFSANQAAIEDLEQKSHGDYSQLSPEDQARAVQLLGPAASSMLKSRYAAESKK